MNVTLGQAYLRIQVAVLPLSRVPVLCSFGSDQSETQYTHIYIHMRKKVEHFCRISAYVHICTFRRTGGVYWTLIALHIFEQEI